VADARFDPVGYNSVLFPTGGNGWVISTDVMVNS
jgi:hypothetical protein